jgi:hypothetical protein
MEIRKMSQSELDKAIKEELERVGGFDAWRRKGSTEETSEPPKPFAPDRSRSLSVTDFLRRVINTPVTLCDLAATVLDVSGVNSS